jgi:hypothetical protein
MTKNYSFRTRQRYWPYKNCVLIWFESVVETILLLSEFLAMFLEDVESFIKSHQSVYHSQLIVFIMVFRRLSNSVCKIKYILCYILILTVVLIISLEASA